ncbi:MAG: hypothetical protein AAGC68_00230 [Verrucomicrobiota bacterium]
MQPKEKDRFALEKVAGYIWENPERGGLEGDWPFRGSIAAGHPEICWHGILPENFWDDWWQRK